MNRYIKSTNKNNRDTPKVVEMSEGWNTGTLLQKEFTGALFTPKNLVRDASWCRATDFDPNSEEKKDIVSGDVFNGYSIGEVYVYVHWCVEPMASNNALDEVQMNPRDKLSSLKSKHVWGARELRVKFKSRAKLRYLCEVF